MNQFTGIFRDTKDLDIFIKPNDYESSLDIFAEAGFETSLTFSHWLAKAIWNDHMVDIIFSSGNALSEVDDSSFENAVEGKLFGICVKFIPPEEMIWSKAFVMERERYDGADVNHIMLFRGKTLDWNRLIRRFGSNWHVLLSHLILLGFVYPSEREIVPEWVMHELISRLEHDLSCSPGLVSCRGTLLSRSQYGTDIENGEFQDARLFPNGKMSEKQIRAWDEGAPNEHQGNC